jgi:hypothetical protein
MWKTPVRGDLLPAEGLPTEPSRGQRGEEQPRERSNASEPTSRPAKKRAKPSKQQEIRDDDTDCDKDPDYDSEEEREEGSPRRAPRSSGSRKQAANGGGGGGVGVSKQRGGAAAVPSPTFCGFFRTRTETGLGVYDNVFVCGAGGPGALSTRRPEIWRCVLTISWLARSPLQGTRRRWQPWAWMWGAQAN